MQTGIGETTMGSQEEMRAGASGRYRQRGPRALALAGFACLLALASPAQTFRVLYSFSATDTNGLGGSPSTLMLSTNGELYGTCVNGGANGFGTLYQVTPSGTPAPLYSFTYGTTAPYDGANPFAGLTQGTNGLLYGMAQSGGSNGYGTIFDVSTNGAFTSLYSFLKEKGGHSTNASGAAPKYQLVLNTHNGNFYGTAVDGGTNGFGTVLQVTHQGKVTVCYSFSNSVDGAYPRAALLLYTNRNFYGTASQGGSNGYGTVFQVTAAGLVTPIYSFTNGIDGANPEGALIDGKDGFLYGTCSAGGTNGTGTIYNITTNGVLTPLYSFSAGTQSPDTGGVENEYNADGINPLGLLLGNDGNFYGVAYYGGPVEAGTIYQFTRSGALNVLYGFSYAEGGGPNKDGANPISLLLAMNGSLYGTAYNNGSNASGTLFSISLAPVITTQPTNQLIGLNGNATFSVTASGAQSCQWQFDDFDLPDATNFTLTITNAKIAEAGYYQAIVANFDGAVVSSAVTLCITNVPFSFLTDPSDLQYAGGQFALTLAGLTGQGDMVIEVSSDLLNWTPVYTNLSGFGDAPLIDSAAGSFPVRFYRARSP
jgi:uncharacterized repeat protein (TIGR03803 family)